MTIVEAWNPPILPGDGPGRASNGNFVIREFSVFAQAVPEPASVAIWSLIGLSLAGFGYFRSRRK